MRGSQLPSAGINVQLQPHILSIYLLLTVNLSQYCHFRTGLHTASNSTRAQFSFQAEDLPRQRLPLRRSPPCPPSPSPNCTPAAIPQICGGFYLFFSPTPPPPELGCCFTHNASPWGSASRLGRTYYPRSASCNGFNFLSCSEHCLLSLKFAQALGNFLCLPNICGFIKDYFWGF